MNDCCLTVFILQAVPPTTWYRFVAGLNAQLRLVRKGCLRSMFRPILKWLETFANPTLKVYGLRVDLARFQLTAGGFCQYGLLVYAIDDQDEQISFEGIDGSPRINQPLRYYLVVDLHMPKYLCTYACIWTLSIQVPMSLSILLFHCPNALDMFWIFWSIRLLFFFLTIYKPFDLGRDT